MFPPTFSSSPFAPQFGNALGKPHGRTQTLKYVNGYAIADLPKSAALEAMVPPEMPEGMEPVAEEEAKETEGGIPMSKLPAWVAFDRKVCRFYAYFKEGVDESYQENYRIRKCIIYYYLEDDSIHVAEPKQENSGIPQGVFLKRQQQVAGELAAMLAEQLLQSRRLIEYILESPSYSKVGCVDVFI